VNPKIGGSSVIHVFGKKNVGLLVDHLCRAPLHEECPQHHGHKWDPGVTPGTCGAIGERDQEIPVWMKAMGILNASHPQGLES
jgi:hypothetical protein